MPPEPSITEVVDRASDLMTGNWRKAADDLADAAEKLGKCRSMDSERPEHANHCAVCAVKRALQRYKQISQ